MAKPLKTRSAQSIVFNSDDEHKKFVDTLMKIIRWGMWVAFIFLVLLCLYLVGYHVYVHDITWVEGLIWDLITYGTAFLLGQMKAIVKIK